MKKKMDMMEEEYQTREEMEEAGTKSTPIEYLSLDNLELKFYNTLPGKIKPRITYLCIDEYRRYELTFSPIPGDYNSDSVNLKGDSPDNIRKMIEWYLDYYSRPYQDYDPEIELS